MAQKFIEAVGRRKTASARVRITPGSSSAITINGKEASQYFTVPAHLHTVRAPLALSGEVFAITAVVKGGGVSAQAEAVRHGIARAIEAHDGEKRTELKKAGFLKRDPRAKERRKPGLKKARKAPQWSKR